MIRKGDRVHIKAGTLNGYYIVKAIWHDAAAKTMSMDIKPMEEAKPAASTQQSAAPATAFKTGDLVEIIRRSRRLLPRQRKNSGMGKARLLPHHNPDDLRRERGRKGRSEMHAAREEAEKERRQLHSRNQYMDERRPPKKSIRRTRHERKRQPRNEQARKSPPGANEGRAENPPSCLTSEQSRAT